MLDFMARTVRNNKALLKKRKPLRKIYEENNLYYIRKNVQKRANKFDPEKRRLFLEKFHAKQKKVHKRLSILLVLTITLFTLILYLILVLI